LIAISIPLGAENLNGHFTLLNFSSILGLPLIITNLQFFSRYSYIWKFPKAQELAYSRFVQPSNLISFRLVTFITLFGMTVFLIIDYFRDVDFSIVLATRLFVLAAASGIMTLSFQKWITNNTIQWGIVCIAFLNFGSSMVTADFARMPPYYITNLLFLILVLVVTASGLNFRTGLALNLACLLTFICFSQFIKRESYYFSQYPHLIVSFLYIHIVGIVLENRRRVNFLQFTDLVEQKKIVESLNHQKNKIISILSHDLGTPMHSLSILLHLQSSGNIKEEELKPFLNDVGSQLDSITSLLQNLVRWSRSQMEGFVPDKKLVDLSNYLHEGVKLFRSASQDKNLQVALTSETPLMVYADEEMLRIVIRNLISNAVKFAEAGTELTIKGFNKDGNLVTIMVENIGVPIPRHLHEKLFTYQMPSSEDTSGARGTGLGLAVAAYFIRITQGPPHGDHRSAIKTFYDGLQ
jgi:signal transduction histidine kinase